MTRQEYFEALNGQYIEMAGTSARNQCVDNANFYIKYVLGLPIIEWTNAVDFPSKAGPNYDYILKTPTGVPVEGDLVIWGGNTYGHIAVFIEGNEKRFTSFDENYPTGSPCHVQVHTYSNVLGWLHPKVTPQADALQVCLTQHTQLVDEANKKDAEITRLNNETTELQNEIDGYKSQIQHYTDYEKQLAITLGCDVDEAKIMGEITKQINDSDQLRNVIKENEDLKKSNAELARKVMELEETVKNTTLTNSSQAEALQEATNTIQSLNAQIANLKEEAKLVIVRRIFLTKYYVAKFK